MSTPIDPVSASVLCDAASAVLVAPLLIGLNAWAEFNSWVGAGSAICSFWGIVGLQVLSFFVVFGVGS